MSKYKCINSFFSTSRKRYYLGAIIGKTEYNGLKERERKYFKEMEEYSPSVNRDDRYPFTDYAPGPSDTDTPIRTSDDSPSNSDNDFSGYRGGDSGGGGASSDYDSNDSSSSDSSSDSGSSSDD